MIKDVYENWSIEKTCDTVTLESSHPLTSPIVTLYNQPEMFFTHECKYDEIAYFKVDVNLIGMYESKLGNVLEAMSKRHDHYEKTIFSTI